MTLSINRKNRRFGNWIINLFVLLCNLNIIISESCHWDNGTVKNLPQNWPCQWNNGVIPFTFDNFATSPKRLVNLVRKGHRYIETRSCLVFQEHDPVSAARKNFTYLFYTYSEVLESCCLRFFTKAHGRRLVLITPVCSLPPEVAHTTFHGLGLKHSKNEAFQEYDLNPVIFIRECGARSVDGKIVDPFLKDKKVISEEYW